MGRTKVTSRASAARVPMPHAPRARLVAVDRAGSILASCGLCSVQIRDGATICFLGPMIFCCNDCVEAHIHKAEARATAGNVESD